MIALKSASSIVWGLIWVSYSVSIFSRAGLAHFTWWSLFLFAFYAFLGIIGRERSLFWYIGTIQLLVIGGVLLMSGLECKLFTTTETDVGETVYFFGNFALHYFPLVAILALTGVGETTVWEGRRHNSLNDCLCALGTIMIYFGIFDPAEIYSCGVDKRWMLVGCISIVIFPISLICLFQRTA